MMDGNTGALILIVVLVGFLVFGSQPKLKLKAPRVMRRRTRKTDNHVQKIKVCLRCGTINSEKAVECKNNRCREDLHGIRVDRLVRSKAK